MDAIGREITVAPPTRVNGRILATWLRYRDLGVLEDMDTDLARHVRVTNVAAIVHFLLTFPYFFVFIQLDLRQAAFFVLVLVGFYAVSVILNALGRTTASRILLLTSINVAIFAYSVILGRDLGILYVYYFCLIAPFMLFHIRERWKLIFCSTQPVAFWILLQGPFGLGDTSLLSPEATHFFYLCLTTTTAVMILGCTLLIYLLHQKSVAQLRQAKEEAEASNRAKSEFLATISHEIRTPMNGILGSAQLLALSPMTPKQKTFLDIVQTSGKLLLAIINDILDFSKIESGNLELEEVQINLGSLLQEVLTLHRMEAEIKGLYLRLELGPDGPAEVRGDPTRLTQAVLNLVSNAVKFTSKGGVTISLRSAGDGDGHVDVAICVRDTGIGIPKEKIDRLFKPFSQVDSSTTREYGGTGLGLAIVRRLAAMMDGDLAVETREGLGSSFTFRARLNSKKLP